MKICFTVAILAQVNFLFSLIVALQKIPKILKMKAEINISDLKKPFTVLSDSDISYGRRMIKWKSILREQLFMETCSFTLNKLIFSPVAIQYHNINGFCGYIIIFNAIGTPAFLYFPLPSCSYKNKIYKPASLVLDVHFQDQEYIYKGPIIMYDKDIDENNFGSNFFLKKYNNLLNNLSYMDIKNNFCISYIDTNHTSHNNDNDDDKFKTLQKDKKLQNKHLPKSKDYNKNVNQSAKDTNKLQSKIFTEFESKNKNKKNYQQLTRNKKIFNNFTPTSKVNNNFTPTSKVNNNINPQISILIYDPAVIMLKKKNSDVQFSTNYVDIPDLFRDNAPMSIVK
jgi:hypothetical protein